MDFVYFSEAELVCCQKLAFPKVIWLAITSVSIKQVLRIFTQVLKNLLY